MINSTPTLHITVVGHTNTGKTSLLRTLLRETNFGEVKDAPSTTKSVIEAKLNHVNYTSVLESQALQFYFYDTPGFEDAIGLNEYLLKTYLTAARKTYRHGFELFLEDEKAENEFSQEAKIIRQLLQSNFAFYVIDCRNKPLSKHEEELALLERISLPILPILNFTAAQRTHKVEWCELMKSLGLHTYVEYDTFSPPHERRLFEKISLLIDEFYEPLQAWLLKREAQNLNRHQEALGLACGLLVNLASFRRKSLKNKIEESSEFVRATLLKAEQEVIDALLKLYQFSSEDVVMHHIQVMPILLDENFFSIDNLTKFSRLFLKGSTIGAISVASVDALTGFASLGTVTAVGGILGGLYTTSQYHANRLLDYLRDEVTITYDSRLLVILISRILVLIQRLEGRGHASTEQIELQATQLIQSKLLTKNIEKCRLYPEWSMLVEDFTASTQRAEMVQNLIEHLSNDIKKT